eukprot:403366616
MNGDQNIMSSYPLSQDNSTQHSFPQNTTPINGTNFQHSSVTQQSFQNLAEQIQNNFQKQQWQNTNNLHSNGNQNNNISHHQHSQNGNNRLENTNHLHQDYTNNNDSKQLQLSPMNFGDPLPQLRNLSSSDNQPTFQRTSSAIVNSHTNGFHALSNVNQAQPIKKIDPKISQPSAGQSIRNLSNYLIAEFNQKILEFTKLSDQQREKFHALASSNQFNNQYNQTKTHADLYRQYVVGYDGIGQYDRIKQMKKFITNAKYLIENIQIALQSSQFEEQYFNLDIKYQLFLRQLNIKTFELLGKEEVFAIEKKAFIVRQLEQTQDPEFDLKSAFRILSNKFDRSFKLNAIVNLSNQFPKNKNLIELVKTQFLGPQNYMLRKVEEDVIQKKVISQLKYKIIENQADFFDFINGTGITLHSGTTLKLVCENVMTFIVRLEYIFQEKEFIILLADFSFDAIGDQLITEQLAKLKSYNRAVIQRQEQKKKMIAMINDKVFKERADQHVSQINIILSRLSDIFRSLAFRKFQSDLQKMKNVKNLQIIKATPYQGETIRFYYNISQSERPLQIDVVNLNQKKQNVDVDEIDFLPSQQQEIYSIKFNRSLPILNNDVIVKMSKYITIYSDGHSSFNIQDHLEVINKRFRYMKLIEYYDSFKDEISLTYPFIDISINGESQTNDMLRVTDPKKFNQVNQLFQILVPHAFFQQVEYDFIDIRRGQNINQQNAQDFETFPTSPVFQSWMMKTLQKQFGFNLNQLAQAHRHLYSNQMVIVVNVKPIVGEIEMKLDKRPRNIIYVKLSIDQYLRRVQYMGDLNVSVEHTQIQQHIASKSPIFSMRLDTIYNQLCGQNNLGRSKQNSKNLQDYQQEQINTQNAQQASRKVSSFQGNEGNQSNLSDVQELDAFGRFQSQSLQNQSQYHIDRNQQSYQIEIDTHLVVDLLLEEDLLDQLLYEQKDPVNQQNQQVESNAAPQAKQNNLLQNNNVTLRPQANQNLHASLANLHQQNIQNIDETLEQMKRQSMQRIRLSDIQLNQAQNLSAQKSANLEEEKQEQDYNEQMDQS